MSFAKPRGTVYKQRIVYHSAAAVGHSFARGVGEFVRAADYKGIEGIVIFCVFIAFFKLVLLFLKRIKIHRLVYSHFVGNPDVDFNVEAQRCLESLLEEVSVVCYDDSSLEIGVYRKNSPVTLKAYGLERFYP